MAGIIGRSAGHHVYPHPDFFKDYKSTVQPELDRIISHIKTSLSDETKFRTLEDYIAHFPSKKRKAYARTFLKMKNHNFYPIPLKVEPNFKKAEAVYA